MQMVTRGFLLCLATSLSCVSAWATQPTADELTTARNWAVARLTERGGAPQEPGLYVRANHDPVQKNGRFGKPLKLGDTEFTRGLYCHANSDILVRLPNSAKTFEASIGVDNNQDTGAGGGSVVFAVSIGGKEVFRSDVLHGAAPAVPVSVDLAGTREFHLTINDSGDGIGCDQADWADAKVTLADGSTLWLAELPMAQSTTLLDPSNLPFSFVYGGVESSVLLPRWKYNCKSETLDENRVRFTLTFNDPQTDLEVRCAGVQYKDFPTVEWTLYFKNNSATDTHILEDIQPLDIRMERADRGEYVLHHFVGSPCQPNDYEPLETILAPTSAKTIAGARGRATSSDMCFFNVDPQSGDGLIIALGWPGQWAAQFTRDDAKGLHVRAGQELTHFKLLPGEEVRTPLVALQFWQGGDWIRAQNVWRRWMITHNLPRPGGKHLAPFVTADTSAQFGEMIGANEENQIFFIDRYREEKLDIEYWWMDAGWYPCEGSWPKTGTWEVDTQRFPRGLRAISDHAHQNGVDIIVWFEPERVAGGTWITDSHPDWVLGGKNGGLLNLGNPEALKWLIDRVDRLIDEQGIDLYRQDFNCDPLDAWRANDAAEGHSGDRQGITEIKHIMGLFEYWDTLVQRRNGNLLIDTCASGGRRNDLETLRRAVPLWRTDFPFNPTATQCHTYGISFWIPLSGTGVKVIDNYDFRSNAAPEFTCHWDLRDKSLDYDLLRRQLADWRAYSPNFMGDYYPLTPYSTSEDTWMAWQFDRPEEGKGMVQAFRRPNSVYMAAAFPLRGLDIDAQYRVTDIDTGTAETVPGKVLVEQGLTVSAPARRSAVIVLYARE